MAKGVIIAAPHSGSGKTLITLGLLRALKNRGLKVASAKVGPDYIDPGFHTAATGRNCINLDLWAMGETAIRALSMRQAVEADLLVIEGVMGLFDGPQGAPGSTADVAAALGLPVVLVIDASRQSGSVAALAQGFAKFRADIQVAGVILNRVSSDRHEDMLREALAAIRMPVLGAVRQIDSLHIPSRHLGLIQAQENQELEAFIESAGSGVARETNLDSIFESAVSLNISDSNPQILPPLAQRIAIARDEAFSFIYAHVLEGWRKAGAELSFFSPLADEAPAHADAIFLPGGYPELHAGKLSANNRFLESLRSFKGVIYGECGGYMVLGEGLIDKDGQRHAMAGLLPVTTSFAKRKLHLGYRQLKSFGAPWPGELRAHEFHYSTLESEGRAPALFEAKDAAGNTLGVLGHKLGTVMGSYAHVISVASTHIIGAAS